MIPTPFEELSENKVHKDNLVNRFMKFLDPPKLMKLRPTCKRERQDQEVTTGDCDISVVLDCYLTSSPPLKTGTVVCSVVTAVITASPEKKLGLQASTTIREK